MLSLIAAAAALASPGQLTLSDLRSICSGAAPSAACRLYIFGVMEGASIASAGQTANRYCVPKGVNVAEITAVVLRLMTADLERFPEDTAMPAVSFIAVAL